VLPIGHWRQHPTAQPRGSEYTSGSWQHRFDTTLPVEPFPKSNYASTEPSIRILDNRQCGGKAPAPAAAQPIRTYPRYQFTAAAEALDAHSKSRMSARTSDLGRGGCYIDTFCPFPVNALVKLRITREQRCFLAQAQVVYSKTGMGMGLEFTEIAPQQLEVLDGWLAELSGASSEFDATPNDLEAKASADETLVLSELIGVLMRKSLLTAGEGKTLLAMLLHGK